MHRIKKLYFAFCIKYESLNQQVVTPIAAYKISNYEYPLVSSYNDD